MSTPFKGTVSIDIKDPMPDWTPNAQPIAPRDAFTDLARDAAAMFAWQ